MARSGRTLVATCLALALAAPAGASAAPPSGTLAANAADGHIAAYGDVVAWNEQASPTTFRLVVRSGGVTAPLPIASSPHPFDVAAGRGPNGATWLVWTRCTGGSPDDGAGTAGACDIVRYDLAHPGERRVAGAATLGWNEHAPSIDGDRVAFARVRPGGALERVALTATGARATSRPVSGGVPASTCRLSESGCAPVTWSLVTGTALRGDRLAVGTRVQVPDAFGICGRSEARLLDLRTGMATPLAEAVCGLGGQTYGSFGFDAAGAIWLVRTCPGDTGGCKGQRGDPLRWDPATRSSQRRAVPRGRGFTGLAVAGDTLVTAVAASPASSCPRPPESSGCFIVRVPVAGAPEAAPLDVAGDLPPDGYLAVSGPGGRVIAPPARLACETSGPAPETGAEVWAGAQGGRAAVAVVARSGSRTVRATVSPPRLGRDWSYVPLKLGGRSACGRTWHLTYRAGSRTRTFRTTFAKG